MTLVVLIPAKRNLKNSGHPCYILKPFWKKVVDLKLITYKPKIYNAKHLTGTWHVNS